VTFFVAALERFGPVGRERDRRCSRTSAATTMTRTTVRMIPTDPSERLNLLTSTARTARPNSNHMAFDGRRIRPR
jgi:hypothetical protein